MTQTWIKKILLEGVQANEQRELLAQSLFYYCCGRDTTPVVAFGADYPLYIYADIGDYGHSSLPAEAEMICRRLEKHGFTLLSAEDYPSRNAVLSRWKAPDQREFSLLYICEDAYAAYDRVYRDRCCHILPKCIANIRYEMMPVSRFHDETLDQAIKRVEWVMGHCHSSKYRQVRSVPYHGDFSSSPEVALYHRMYWYVE